MARRSVLGLVAGGISALLGGCGLLGGNSYRFKMTVEVETPQGLRTGSSVYEVIAHNLTALTSEEAERSAGVRGEALMVDLPDGPIFVLLKTPDHSPYKNLAQLSMAALDEEYQNDWVESVRRIARSWSTLRGEVAYNDWPIIVRFRDIKDPTTVERVKPDTIGIKRIVIETTTDVITTGIDKRLGWISRIDGSLTRRLLSPDPTNPPFSAQITTQNFSTEISRAK